MGIYVLLFLCLFWLLNKVDCLKSILIIICNPIYLHNYTITLVIDWTIKSSNYKKNGANVNANLLKQFL